MIELVAVETGGRSDSGYYLKVSSEGKALKESSMHRRFAEHFEEGLGIIAKCITSKHGTKKYDKVNQRIGRLKEKYPSVKWNQGVYFIRTSPADRDERPVWKVYNCIREIERMKPVKPTCIWDYRPIGW
jgi:hypothetical protein